jgi:hypothetical protein
VSVAAQMIQTASECARTPHRASVWSERLGKYICSQDPEFKQTKTETEGTGGQISLSPAFKLVFLTAAGGTLIFVAICIITTVIAGREPHPLLERIVSGLFDLAKIGFGAIVGLLGAKSIKTG